ncbi:glycoside hydrolase family 43 protein [Pseudoxanthomonas wuyuanensis]|uniref:glycoside hydrolase family 43 protein n=1 Tax=Pseudoxanthomonas wuyuanensis TaxID=1073196 RepID=UPI0013894E17|nr:glycoside hydrolase family 43 protein [Pseudoxanthomonas wuyuanensis]KAF1722788.1 glycoside hydrolase 43 family protein [Pseudoxanthomonas wuyuanensis]
MKRYVLALAACLAAAPLWAGDALFSEVSYTGDDGGPAVAASQFRNPVLAGFYPDPSAIRVGEDFYLVTSTFGYFPGLPIFHSKDLVSWRQIGNAIHRPGQIDYGQNEQITRGLFAATISHHDGTFYVANTCFYCDRGNFIVTAKDPAGPWSDPIWLGFSGIDPSLFFDDDGRAWIVNNDIPEGEMRYDGHRAIWLQQYDVTAGKMVGPRTVLVDGGADPASKPEHIEGPHLFKHDGWYFLTAAEGGTGDMHAQMVWRSRQVTGPYEPFPGNPTLTQRDLDPQRPEPVTSTGHAQFVKLEDGTWWAVFLAVRPYHGDQYKTQLGRETFLLPVTWKDGWPVILPRGERVPMVLERPALPRGEQPLATSGRIEWVERFSGPALPPQWVTIHPPQTAWFRTGAGGLSITPSTVPLGTQGIGGPLQPAYVAHRLQHHQATLTATLARWDPAAGELAGLALIQNENYHYIVAVERDDQGPAVSLYRRAGKDTDAVGQRLARVALASTDKPVSLRFELKAPGLDALYAVDGGDWQPVAKGLDSSLLSIQTAGGFIGNTFGLYAYRRQDASAAK